MRFDAYAVLSKLRAEGGGRATRATCATQHPDSTPRVAHVAGVARRTTPDSEISRCPVSADACRTSRTCRRGQAAKCANVIPLRPHIAAAVAEAFEDYAATDDPHAPRAWM